MTDEIRNYLQKLYAPEQAQAAYQQLMALLDQAQSRIKPAPAAELFSEKDVVLITYGDSLRRPGETPLQTLHHFAKQYLSGLVSTLHILPFYPYSSDDGFSVKDFYAVNPDLGDWEDMERLGQEFDLMFDAVFNHMSAQSDWFRRFIEGDPEFQTLFRTESPDVDLSQVVRPRTSPLLTPYVKTNGETVHVWTTFSADQVDLDFRYPETLLRFIDILLFYVEKGARMIRLDAIAFLWKVPGTSSLHLPETHTVIQLMRSVLDRVAPGTIIITETNVPHPENIAYFAYGNHEAQMVYNFTLPPLLFYTMLSGDATLLREWVNTLSTPSDRTTFFNFTASHDGIGVRPVEGILSREQINQLIEHVNLRGGRVSYRQNTDGTQTPYELNITYVDAVTLPDDPIETQVRRFIASQAVMLSLAGVPAVYIHSLLGSHNDIEGMLQSGHNRTINRAKLNFETLQTELFDAASFRTQIFDAYRNLIGVRTTHPAFHPNAAQEAIDLGAAGVFALRRESAEGSQVIALHNLSSQPVSLDLSDWIGHPVNDLISGETVEVQTMLEPYQVRWLEV